MKNLFLLFILGFSQSSIAASSVWLVESDQNRLFLAGTIHILRASDYPFPAAFESSYKQSQILAFETDIAETQTAAFQKKLTQALSLPQNVSLKDLLNDRSIAKLESYFSNNQLTLKQFSGFKPSMIALTLTMIELKKIGAGSHGVDLHYFNKAKQDKKKMLALESPQQQIDFLANMGKGQEDLMIQQTLEEIDTLASQFSSMVESWREGDAKQLEALFVEPMQQEFDALYQQLLVERNLNWLPQLLNYLKTAETEMVLVGSAHLVGKDGLIKHLKQAGYRVTQLD